jgi:hypothetical protein
VLAAVVIGVLMLRGSGSSQSSGSAPGPPGLDLAVTTGSDPIVGCYQWTNNAPVAITANHTVVAGAVSASWQVVNPAQHTYKFIWQRSIDTVTISPDQRSLSGTNQYGATVTGTRVAGASGLVGMWHWAYNVPGTVPTVTVYPNGTYVAATALGTWKAIDASRGSYALTWSDPPTDSITLSPDGTAISGVDQWGLTTSAVKANICGGK